MNIAAGRSLKSMLPFGLFTALLAAVLFLECALSTARAGWLWRVAVEIQAACRDAGTQWMAVVCLVSYFVAFLFLERRILPQKNAENTETEGGGQRSEVGRRFSPIAFLRDNAWDANFWLIGLVGMVLLRYAFAYETAVRSLQPLVLLAGIVFGKGIALWARSLKSKVQGLKLEGDDSSGCATFSPSEAEKGIEVERVSAPSAISHQLSTFNRTQAILGILVLLLAGASLWQPEYGMDFQYRGQRRWTGAWDNPNLYGLLMGVGAILAVGLFFRSLKSKIQCPGNAKERHLTPALSPNEAERESSAPTAWRWVKIILFLTAAGMCGFGLVKSYSRGAWVGTACGLGWLLWKWISRAHLTKLPHPQPLSHPLGEGGVGLSPSDVEKGARSGEGELFPRLASRSCWLPASVILASVLVLSFWQFRHTENPLARRAFSIGNPNDFSWRNRVSTWAGAVTMMRDRPLVGYGWGKAEAVFGEKYKPVRLEDAAAIQMNDYLMLGISCGVPALLGLLAYLWLVLMRSAEWGVRSGEKCGSVGLPPSVVAAAGATVLLVGFWFDGGLFKLPTAAVSWVLIELSRGSSRGNKAHANEGGARYSGRAVGDAETDVRHLTPAQWLPKPATRWMPKTQASRRETWSPFEAEREGGVHGVPCPAIVLRWLAGILAGLALAQTVLHLGLPRLVVSERTLAIARQLIVSPKAEKDFEFLALQPIWSAKKIGTLLEHVELANYNRELVNWKLDDQIYQLFVLSPPIDVALDGDMNWRRPLWESFYPRIRKENSLEAAAAIVVRQLRERVSIQVNDESPDAIATIWQRQSTNEKDFPAVYIAALRAAGIPARKSTSGQAEFWNGTGWKTAPQPLVEVVPGTPLR